METAPDRSAPLHPAARKVAAELARRGFTAEVVVMPDSTRSAREAATAIGCDVAQIAKSLVFRAAVSARPVLVIASGANRVDTALVGAALGETVERADADWVRQTTGYSIGGVPPLGHETDPVTFIDEDLMPFLEIWAAAGTPHAVFRMEPRDLESLTGGTVIRLAER